MMETIIAVAVGGVCAIAGGYYAAGLNSELSSKKMIWEMRIKYFSEFLQELSFCKEKVNKYYKDNDFNSNTKFFADAIVIKEIFNNLQYLSLKLMMILKPSSRNLFFDSVNELEKLNADIFKNHFEITKTVNNIHNIFQDHLDELNIFDDDGYIFEDK